MTEKQYTKAIELHNKKQELQYLLSEIVDTTTVRLGNTVDYGRVAVSLDGESERDIDNYLYNAAAQFRDYCVEIVNKKINELEREFESL
ncbi:hypothetical protein [uncultured Microscilla sp.]|uniref:hypothetical protein n=1 Tax=uncultured Microscilla sp. TaxID=432653 RepID=UPI0026061B6D|nr:hypothetical protein [uncultured Microscilla sp.]